MSDSKPYGKCRVTNTNSGYYNEVLTLNEIVRYRDGSESVFVADTEGTELSFNAKDIELTEVSA